MNATRIAGLVLGLGVVTFAGRDGAAAADGPFAGWPSSPFSGLDGLWPKAGQPRSTSLEIATYARPVANMLVQAFQSDLGAVAAVVLHAGTADDPALVSIVTLSPPGAENATTVQALTETADGPVFAAASTQSGDTGDGTAAYALVSSSGGAVFRATGDLSGIGLRSWSFSNRREAAEAAFYAWDMPDWGETATMAFVRPMHAQVREIAGGGVDIDLPEAVSATALPLIAVQQSQSLRSNSVGLQAGVEVTQQVDRGLFLWSQLGLGLSHITAKSRVDYAASVADVGAGGALPLGSTARLMPSAMLSVGLTQAAGKHQSFSLFVAAEADHSPTLALETDGPAEIDFRFRKELSIGLSIRWEF